MDNVEGVTLIDLTSQQTNVCSDGERGDNSRDSTRAKCSELKY